MAAKDTKSKEFLSDNVRFADLCNYYLFDGEQVILPENLQEQDTTELLSVFGVKNQEVQVQKWRDILKSVVIKKTETCTYAIIGIENQTDIHYAMPVRNMIYDALNYGRQISEAGKKKKKDRDYKNQAEFLSQFGSDDRLTPVITLTLYWGAEAWDGPRSIHEMLLPTEESLLPYVNDYRLNLIVPGEITDFQKFRTSLGAVLAVIKVSKDTDAMEKLVTENPVYKDLESEAVQTINMFAGLKLKVERGAEKMDMCKAWADQKQRGVEEGIIRGISQGITEGEILKLINLVMKKLKKGLSAEEIADIFEEDVDEIQNICDAVALNPEADRKEIYEKIKK